MPNHVNGDEQFDSHGSQLQDVISTRSQKFALGIIRQPSQVTGKSERKNCAVFHLREHAQTLPHHLIVEHLEQFLG